MINLYFIDVSHQTYTFILSSVMLHVAPITVYSFLMILGKEY